MKTKTLHRIYDCEPGSAYIIGQEPVIRRIVVPISDIRGVEEPDPLSKSRGCNSIVLLGELSRQTLWVTENEEVIRDAMERADA